jgi:hypothetical protein
VPRNTRFRFRFETLTSDVTRAFKALALKVNLDLYVDTGLLGRMKITPVKASEVTTGINDIAIHALGDRLERLEGCVVAAVLFPPAGL